MLFKSNRLFQTHGPYKKSKREDKEGQTEV